MLVSIYYLSLAIYMLTHELSINRADNSHTLHSEQCNANTAIRVHMILSKQQPGLVVQTWCIAE